MTSSINSTFKRDYQTHLQHLRLKGLQPKTIEAYARAIRRIGDYFDHQLHDLSEAQLLDYFSDLLSTHSWSAVKLDLYGLKFFYQHVLNKPWVAIDLIKPPHVTRLPDIVTIEEAAGIFRETHKLSYRVFYFTVYSLSASASDDLFMHVPPGLSHTELYPQEEFPILPWSQHKYASLAQPLGHHLNSLMSHHEYDHQ